MSPRRQLVVLSASLLILMLSSGCRNTHMDFDLQPEGEQLRRQFTFWTASGAEPDTYAAWDSEFVTRIATIYGGEVPGDLASRHRYTAAFGPRLPDEIGSDGWYLYWPTPMGTLYSYTEFFGGDDDLGADLDATMLVIDRTVEIIDLYLRTEFERDPANERLIAAWNGPIRDDLRNAVLHAWVGSTTRHGDFRNEALGIRLAHYFSERGWFDPEDLPRLARVGFSLPEAESQWNGEILAPLVALGVRAVARRAGFTSDEPLPPILQSVQGDVVAFSEALAAFAQSAESTRPLIDRWLAATGPPKNADTGEPLTAADFLDADLDFIDLGFSGNHLAVRLLAGEEPLATNGRFDDDGTVSWDAMTRRPANAASLSLYAIWVDPANDYQLNHFGEIVLAGEELANYALWYNGLTTGERREWDTLLESFTPGSDIDEQLQQFRFSEDPLSSAEGRQGYPLDF